MSDFNREYGDFLSSIADAPLGTRARLSQAVNLYLGIEKEISSEDSLQETRGVQQRAAQKLDDTFDLLDECWLAFRELDTLIPREDIPGIIGSTLTTVRDPIADGVLDPVYSDEWSDFVGLLERREDDRISYISRALPYQVQRGTATRQRKVSPVVGSVINVFGKVYDFIKSGTTTPPNLQALIKRGQIPDIVYAEVPDFQCSLDAEKLIELDEICNNNITCADRILNTYEQYHCISTREFVDQGERAIMRRKNRDGDGSQISDKWSPGREPIGMYTGIFHLPDTDGDPTNGIQRSTNDCPLPNASSPKVDFKGNVLGSPINNCDFWHGTLVHRSPSIPSNKIYDEAAGRGLSKGSYQVHPFLVEWSDKSTANFSWPVRYTGYQPSPTSPNREWIEGVMHTVDVYGDHTRGTLYCNTNGIIVNTLHDFNEFWAVTNNSEKDNWWNGEFEEDGITPKTSNLGGTQNGGFRYWENIQRCDDWTKSDLSTYTAFPKAEL